MMAIYAGYIYDGPYAGERYEHYAPWFKIVISNTPVPIVGDVDAALVMKEYVYRWSTSLQKWVFCW